MRWCCPACQLGRWLREGSNLCLGDEYSVRSGPERAGGSVGPLCKSPVVFQSKMCEKNRRRGKKKRIQNTVYTMIYFKNLKQGCRLAF